MNLIKADGTTITSTHEYLEGTLDHSHRTIGFMSGLWLDVRCFHRERKSTVSYYEYRERGGCCSENTNTDGVNNVKRWQE